MIEAKLLRGLFPHNRKERLKGPGEVIYEASFNEVNFGQLLEPASVLKDFCVKSGGQFSQLAPGRVSAALMAKPALTPTEVYVARQEAYRALGFGDRLAAVSAAFDTQYYAAAAQGQYPKAIRETLAGAERVGAFGRFECQIGGRPAWLALVEPLRFNPVQDPKNLLRSPTLSLYVKGLTIASG